MWVAKIFHGSRWNKQESSVEGHLCSGPYRESTRRPWSLSLLMEIMMSILMQNNTHKQSEQSLEVESNLERRSDRALCYKE